MIMFSLIFSQLETETETVNRTIFRIEAPWNYDGSMQCYPAIAMQETKDYWNNQVYTSGEAIKLTGYMYKNFRFDNIKQN